MAPHSTWTSAEEIAFVNFLHDNRAESGDGGNFKKPTFQRAVAHITHITTNGHIKDIQSCKNKWTALRKLYRVVLAIKLVSGWHWDDETGASITAETASTWNDYVKKHPEAKPFRNKGWPYFRRVSDIMPRTPPGANVFHPTALQPPYYPPPSQPSDDIFNADPASDNIFTLTPPPQGSIELPGDSSDGDEPQALLRPQKRSREVSTPIRSSTKRVRHSRGADALMSMSTSLSDFGNKISAALAPPSQVASLEATPSRRNRAISRAQDIEKRWLTTRQLVHFIDLLRRDQSTADTYLALDDVDVREGWVLMQLENNNMLY